MNGEFTQQIAEAHMQVGRCCYCGCKDTCTIRCFNTADGTLLWQKNEYKPLGASHSGKLFVVKYTKLTTSFYRQMYSLALITPNAVSSFTASDERFQFKSLYGSLPETNSSSNIWTADIVRIDPDGTETVIAEDVFHSEGTRCQADGPTLGVAPRMLTDARTGFARQHWLCNDDGLIHIKPETNNAVFVEAFDRDRLSVSHRFIIPATAIFPVSTSRPARWVFDINGTIVRVPLYGTASEFQTEMESATGVDSVTVTGGPACTARLTIDIDFISTTGEIRYAAVENSSRSYPSTSQLTNSNSSEMRSIWDLATFSPKVIGWRKVDSGPNEPWSFTSTGDYILTSGSWGAVNNTGGKYRSWSKIGWTMPGGTPNWGYFTRVWNRDLYADLQQIQPTSGVTTIYRSMTAVKNGKVAVNSSACRLTNAGSGDFTTHIIVNESDGSTSAQGWNGLLVSSQTRIDDTGEWLFTGERKRLNNSYGASYAEVAYVESYGTTSGGSDLRETDIRSATVSGKLITSGIVPAVGFSTTAFSQGSANTTTTTLQGLWLCKTETKTAQAEYSYGSYRRDTFNQTSGFERFALSTEWRLRHGTVSGSVFSANKTTNWYAFDVDLATVKSDVAAWYGSVAGGGVAIVRINIFGDDPFLTNQTVPLPTWQLIQEIVVLRDVGSTPNPASPLAPVTMDTIQLQLRNMQQIVTHTLIGSDPATGVIEWQRHVGENSGVAATYNILFATDGQVVISTQCNPDIDPDIFGRGAL